MRKSAGAVDMGERWADYKTDYPKGLRVLRLTTLVWAIGGLIVILFIGFFTQWAPISGVSDIRFLGGLVWFTITASLGLKLGSWKRKIDRLEHLRLLHLQGALQSIVVSDPELSMRGTLLAPSRKRYVIKLSSWVSPWAGNIYDEYGRTIGKGVRSNGHDGPMHSVHENDGTMVLLVETRIPDRNRRLMDTYDIADEKGNLLGTVKSREEWRVGAVLVAPAIGEKREDSEEQEVLVALLKNPPWGGSEYHRPFVINEEKSGRDVAEFKPYDVPMEAPRPLIDRLKKGPMYSLNVLDPSFDRRTLIGLAICFESLREDVRRRNADGD